ncbi:MAG: hypothetical protein HKN91_08450 [Acidimicrobiia bacterium]|nr:hypothetical protein [Acidimicrobiia bacterium]
MPEVIVILFVIVVLIAVGLFFRSRSGGMPTRTVAGAIATEAKALNDVDFNVEGATAHVYFDTAIPAEGADTVLEALMGREAMRVFHEKADHLPLDGVHHVTAHGKRAGSTVAVTTVDVRTPAAMDDMDAPASDDVLRADDVAGSDDLLGALHAMEFGRGSGYRGGSDDLPPLSAELAIPAKVIEAVAGAGGTVDGMSLRDFISGLLRAAGYDVAVTADGTGTARKSGKTTFVQFVDHAAGSHPELDESSVDAFVMKFMSSGADRGMLFTPKFGPYAIYEKERRNDKVKYMTRERLQAFVDSVAMG